MGATGALPVDVAGWGVLGLACVALGYVGRRFIDFLIEALKDEKTRCKTLADDNKEFANVNIALTAALEKLSAGAQKQSDGLVVVHGNQERIVQQLERLHARLDRLGVGRDPRDA